MANLEFDDIVGFIDVMNVLKSIDIKLLWFHYVLLKPSNKNEDNLLNELAKIYKFEEKLYKLSCYSPTVISEWPRRKGMIDNLINTNLHKYVKHEIINKKYSDAVINFNSKHFKNTFGGISFEFRIVKINGQLINYPYPNYNNKRINVEIKTNYRYFKIVSGHYYITERYKKSFFNSPIVSLVSID